MRYVNWRQEIAAKGYQPGGQKLADGSGKFLQGKGNALSIADGPFTEAKEVVSGYFTIQAKSYDEALAVAKTCPHLDYGSLELREIEHVGG